ncbi:MAG TPA: hypothetical protein VGQ83_19895 [Polyangia bacterium]|jgi:hypothetical protein
MPNIELSDTDVRLLLQSLDHCLATCREAAGGGPCEDCDAARALRDRLAAASTTHEVRR